MKDYSTLGYAMSSGGLLENTEAIIREEHPTWNDDKVEKEMDKVLKKATLYNKYNKKPKKAKSSMEDEMKTKKAK